MNQKVPPQGFTLIELLVVLVVVGILMSVAVMNMGGNKLTRELETQASKLFYLMRTAADKAIISNTEIGFRLSDDGYAFLQYDDKNQKWEVFADSKIRSQRTPDWLSAEFIREGDEIRLKVKEEQTRTFDEAIVEPPQLAFYSSGESTPFQIKLRVKGLEQPEYRITSDGVGPIKLIRPGDGIE